MGPLLTPILALAAVSIGIGAILGYTSIQLAVKINPLIEHLSSLLPGINCGSCGFPGCQGYATALVENQVSIDRCTPGGQATIDKIAAALGQESPKTQVKKRAYVFCNGGSQAKNAFEYTGVPTCAAAMQIQGGFKHCVTACLGLGDCVRICTFNAITINDHGVAHINPEKCVNCGACYKICPKKIIRPITHKHVRQVDCGNHDTGKIARSVCAVACIACGACVKACHFEAITIADNLATINADRCTNCSLCVPQCPTKAIN